MRALTVPWSKTSLDDKIQMHEATSNCFYCACDYDHSHNRLWSSVGPTCIVDTLLELTKLFDVSVGNTKRTQATKMIEADTLNVKNATGCSICSKHFHANVGTVPWSLTQDWRL